MWGRLSSIAQTVQTLVDDEEEQPAPGDPEEDIASSFSATSVLEPGDIDPSDLQDQNREQQKLILQLKALIRDRDEKISNQERQIQASASEESLATTMSDLSASMASGPGERSGRAKLRVARHRIVEVEKKLEDKEAELAESERVGQDLRRQLEVQIQATNQLTADSSLDTEVEKVEVTDGTLQDMADRDADNKMAELEADKGNLQLRILELEEMISEQDRLRESIQESREEVAFVKAQRDNLISHAEMNAAEKQALEAKVEQMNIQIGQLQQSTSFLQAGKVSVEMQMVQMEEEKDASEKQRLELEREIQNLRGQIEYERQPASSFDNNGHDKGSAPTELHQVISERDGLAKQVSELKMLLAALREVDAEKDTRIVDLFGQLAAERSGVADDMKQRSLLTQMAELEAELKAERAEAEKLREQTREASSQVDQLMQALRNQAEENTSSRDQMQDQLEAELKERTSECEYLRSQMDDAEDVQEDLQRQVTELQDELHEEVENGNMAVTLLRGELGGAASQIEHLRTSLQTAQQDRETMQQELQTAHDELQSAQMNIQKVQEEFRSSYQQLQQAQQGYVSMQEAFQRVQQEAVQYQVELQNMQPALQSMQEDLQATQEELTTSRKNLHATQDELQATQHRLQTLESELQTTEEDSLSVQQKLQSTCKELLLELEAKKREIEESRSQLEHAHAELHTAQHDLQIVQQKGESTQMQQHAIQQELETTQQSLQFGYKELQVKLEVNERELQTTRHNLEQCNGELQAARRHIEQSNAKLQQLQHDIEERHQELQHNMEELDRSNTEVDNLKMDLKAEIQRSNHHESTASQLRQQIEEIQQMSSNEKSEQMSMRDDIINGLRQELQQNAERLHATRTQLDETAELVAHKQASILQLQETLVEAQSRHDDIQKTQEQTNRQLNESLSQIGVLESQLQISQGERLQSDMQCQKMQEGVTMLGNELQTSQSHIVDFQNQLKVLKQAEGELNESQDNLKDLKLQLNENISKLQFFKEQVSTASHENVELVKLSNEQSLNLAEKQTQLDSASATISELTAQVANLDNALYGSQLQLDMLNKTVAQETEQNRMLFAEKDQQLSNMAEILAKRDETISACKQNSVELMQAMEKSEADKQSLEKMLALNTDQSSEFTSLLEAKNAELSELKGSWQEKCDAMEQLKDLLQKTQTEMAEQQNWIVSSKDREGKISVECKDKQRQLDRSAEQLTQAEEHVQTLQNEIKEMSVTLEQSQIHAHTQREDLEGALQQSRLKLIEAESGLAELKNHLEQSHSHHAEHSSLLLNSVDDLKVQLQQYQEQLQLSQNCANQVNSQLEESQTYAASLHDQLKDSSSKLEIGTTQVATLESDLLESQLKLDVLQKKVAVETEQNEMLIEEKDQQLATMADVLAQRDETIATHHQQSVVLANTLKQTTADKEEALALSTGKSAEFDSLLESKNTELVHLRGIHEEKCAQLESLEKKLHEMEATIKEQQAGSEGREQEARSQCEEMQGQVNELVQQLDQTQEHVLQLQEDAKGSRAALEHSQNQAQAQKDDLEEALQQSQSKFAELVSKFESTETQLIETQRLAQEIQKVELIEKDENLKRLLEEVAGLQAQLHSAQEQLQYAETGSDSQIMELRQQFDELSQTNSKYREQLKQYSVKVDACSDIDAANMQQIASLREMIIAKDEALSNLTAELGRMNDVHSNCEQTITQKDEFIKQLAEEMDVKAENVAHYQQHIGELNSQVETLRQELQSKHVILAEREELVTACKSEVQILTGQLKTSHESMQQMSDSSSHGNEEVKRLQGCLSTAEEKIQTITTLAAEKDVNLEKLQKLADERESRAQKCVSLIKTVKAKLKEQVIENKRLTSLMAANQTEADAGTEAVTGLQERIHTLEANAIEAKETTMELEGQKDTLSREVAELKAVCSEKTQQLSKAMHSLEDKLRDSEQTRQRVLTLESEIASLNQKLNQSDVTIHEKDLIVSNLQEQAKQFETEKLSLAAELQHAVAVCSEKDQHLSEALAHLQKQTGDQASMADEARQTVLTLESDKADLMAQLTRLSENATAYEQSILKLETGKSALDNELAQLNTICSEKDESVALLKEKLCHLEAGAGEANKVILAVQAEKEELMNELDKLSTISEANSANELSLEAEKVALAQELTHLTTVCSDKDLQLTNAIADLQKVREEQQTAMKDAKLNLLKLEAEKSMLVDELSQCQNELSNAMTHLQDIRNTELSGSPAMQTLQSENAALVAKLLELTAICSENEEQVSLLQSERQRLSESLMKLNANESCLQEEYSRLRDAHSQLQFEATRDTDDLRTRERETRGRLDDMTQECTRLKAQLDKVDSSSDGDDGRTVKKLQLAEVRNTKMLAKLKQLKATNDRLNAEIAAANERLQSQVQQQQPEPSEHSVVKEEFQQSGVAPSVAQTSTDVDVQLKEQSALLSVMEERLDAVSTELNSERSRNSDHKRRYEHQLRKVQLHSEDLERQLEGVAELQDRLVEMNAAQHGLQRAVKAAEQQRDSATAKCAKLQEQLGQQPVVESLKQRLAESNQLCDAVTEEANTLRKQLTAAREQGSSAQALAESLQAKLQSSEHEMIRIQGLVEEVNSQKTFLQDAVDQLQYDEQQLQEELAIASKSNSSLQEKATFTSEALNNELADIKQELAEALHHRDTLEAEVISLREATSQDGQKWQTLQKDNRHLQQDLDSLHQDFTDLQQQSALLNKTVNESALQISTQQQNLLDTTRANEALQQQLREAIQVGDNLHLQVRQLQQQLHDSAQTKGDTVQLLQQQLSDTTHVTEALRLEIGTHQKQLNDALMARQTADDEARTLNEQLQDVMATKVSLEKELSHLSGELNTSRDALVDQVGTLQQQLSQSIRAYQTEKSQNAAAQHEVLSLRSQLSASSNSMMATDLQRGGSPLQSLQQTPPLYAEQQLEVWHERGGGSPRSTRIPEYSNDYSPDHTQYFMNENEDGSHEETVLIPPYTTLSKPTVLIPPYTTLNRHVQSHWWRLQRWLTRTNITIRRRPNMKMLVSAYLVLLHLYVFFGCLLGIL